MNNRISNIVTLAEKKKYQELINEQNALQNQIASVAKIESALLDYSAIKSGTLSSTMLFSVSEIEKVLNQSLNMQKAQLQNQAAKVSRLQNEYLCAKRKIDLVDEKINLYQSNKDNILEKKEHDDLVSLACSNKKKMI